MIQIKIASQSGDEKKLQGTKKAEREIILDWFQITVVMELV